MENPRCFHLWNNSFGSVRTKKDYNYKLGVFLKWAHKDYESVLLLTKSEITVILEDYALYKKRRVSINSMASYFYPVFSYLEFNDREFNKLRIRRLLKGEKESKGGKRAITDQELIDMDRCAHSKKARTLLHLFAFTGVRPEAISELKLKDIEEMPDGYLCLTIYAGYDKEKPAFIPPTAVKILKEYHSERQDNGEKLGLDSYVIGASKLSATLRPNPISPTTFAQMMNLMMKNAGITRVKTGNRYDLASCNGIRKRFNTKLKRNPDISFAMAEKLMDHKTSALEEAYTVPTKEELFEEYRKAVPDLMFDEAEKLRVENKNKQKKIDELQSSKVRIAELESRMDTINKHLQELKKED